MLDVSTGHFVSEALGEPEPAEGDGGVAFDTAPPRLHAELDRIRAFLTDYADGDEDRYFYANRFIFARLQLDARKPHKRIRAALLRANDRCRACGEKLTGTLHLHRIDDSAGYSVENYELLHDKCHMSHHAAE